MGCFGESGILPRLIAGQLLIPDAPQPAAFQPAIPFSRVGRGTLRIYERMGLYGLPPQLLDVSYQ